MRGFEGSRSLIIRGVLSSFLTYWGIAHGEGPETRGVQSQKCGGVEQLSDHTECRRPLTVALYPIIPAFKEYLYAVKTGFEASPAGRHIRLELPDLTDGYYDPKKTKNFIESMQADVYEVDSVFLRDFVSTGSSAASTRKIQELPKELVPAENEFLPSAQRAARLDGRWYGVPHWVCGNLLFFDKSDAALATVHTLNDLTAVIGAAHKAGQGLPVDLKGKSTLGEFYLMALIDRYQDASKALSHLEPFDTSIEDDLKSLETLCDAGLCRDQGYHEAAGFYQARFATHHGRAMIGYSESLYYVLSQTRNACANQDHCRNDSDLTVSQAPLDEKGSTPMAWVDLLVVDKNCTSQCLRDASEFIHFLNSEPTLVQHLTGYPPRYLMPARASVYANAELQKAAPLYTQLAPLLRDVATPTSSQLGPKLRDYGAKLDQDLPAPK